MKFQAWKKIDQQGIAIKHLWIFAGILVLLNLMLAVFLASAPSQIRVYVPPDLSHGAMLKPGAPDKSNVYAFAFQIFTAINSWPDSGTKDYLTNIKGYHNYLSAAFYNDLIQDNSQRASNGELSRTRIMSGVSGMGYTPDDVKTLGNGSWEVDLHLQIVETLDGAVIKSVIMSYPLIINQVSESIQLNPWGLSIAGYNGQPYRIKTLI